MLFCKILSPPEKRPLQSLLQKEGLCYTDLENQSLQLYAVSDEDILIGYFGIEAYGKMALFRSMATLPEKRQQGYGRKIWQQAKKLMQQKHINEVYLLTNTAADFFVKQGFSVFPRASVPAAIANTTEFKEFCPSDSVCMRLVL